MDMDDIGNFGLPINGEVTPSVQSLSSSSSSSRSRYRLPKKALVTAVAVRSPRAVKVKQRPHPHASSLSSLSLVPNRKKRGSPTWDFGERHEPSSDDEVKVRTQPSSNADNATRTVAQCAPSGNNAIRVAKSNSRSTKGKEPINKQQRDIKSFFRADVAPSHDFVTVASMICENEPDSKTCTQLQDPISLFNQRRKRKFAGKKFVFSSDDEVSSDDELIDNSSDELNAMSNGERDEETHDGFDATSNGEGDEEIHEGFDTHVKHRQCSKHHRLNHVEFEMHQCIFGHRRLPTRIEGRKIANAEGRRHEQDQILFHGINILSCLGNRYTMHMIEDAERRRYKQEKRLLHGTSGVNILSRLVQRSCIPTCTPSIASALGKFANSGRHWNVCNTVELAVSGVDSAGAPYARTNGDICAMSFDRDGVLLATGDDRGTVSIYDFDDVYAMDMTKRNEISWLLRQNYLVDKNERDIDEQNKNSHSEIIKDADRPDNDSDRIAGHSIPPASVQPVLSLQCRASSNTTGHRISSILWSPYNQDHLAVSFANQQEMHIYDTASDEEPLPCLRLLDSRHSRSEGISKAIFIPPSSSSTSTQIVTGGNYGTVSLWAIPQTKSRRRTEPISNLNAQCIWSISALAKGEGVCDMMVLPVGGTSLTKPPVLIAGNGSSLTLLDTNKCTRKAFSTTMTPSIVASWDLYEYVSKELSIIDREAKPPARLWIAAQKITLLRHECTDRNSLTQIGIVLKCGWILLADISLPNPSISSGSKKIEIQIVHRTPRIQCFNSSKERLTTLGGMALQFSLPDVPIPSTSLNGALWLGDVKPMDYTLPSKDKYILGEEHGTLTARTNELKSDSAQSSGILRHPGEGLILAQLGRSFEKRRTQRGPDSCISARLPLPRGLPLALAAHPSGELMVVGYGRGAKTIVTRRKRIAR